MCAMLLLLQFAIHKRDYLLLMLLQEPLTACSQHSVVLLSKIFKEAFAATIFFLSQRAVFFMEKAEMWSFYCYICIK